MEILLFEVAGQRFGIRSADVREVLRAASLTNSPTAPDAIEGLLNLRGRIVPVLDLRMMLNLAPKEMRHVDHLIVLQSQEHQFALRVDRTIDLSQLEANTDKPTESATDHELVAFVSQDPEGLIHVLDSAGFLAGKDVASFVATMSARTATEVAT